MIQLDTEEARVLGCLLEKEATVPDSYPMTLNSLRVACNQSTNRDPILDYDERTVDGALTRLREKGLTRILHPSHGGRTAKYRHVAGEVLELERPALALLTVLLLRGPQTLGELRLRTERAHPFADLGAVADAMRALTDRDEPLAVELPRQPGHKDVRWAHLLSGEPEVRVEPASPRAPSSSRASELDELRAEVDRLRAVVAELCRRLGEDDLAP